MLEEMDRAVWLLDKAFLYQDQAHGLSVHNSSCSMEP